jgi:hypothetical protein
MTGINRSGTDYFVTYTLNWLIRGKQACLDQEIERRELP